MLVESEVVPEPARSDATASNEEAWRRLLRLLRAAQGSFALLLVESSLTASETLDALSRLRHELHRLELGALEVTLSYERWDAFALLEKALARTKRRPGIVLLRGLDRTPPASHGAESGERPPALAHLNIAREAIEHRLGVPLIIWEPPNSITALRRHAPDFFDHFSGIVRFESMAGGGVADAPAVGLLEEGPNPPNQQIKTERQPGASEARAVYEELLSRQGADPWQRLSWQLGWVEAVAQSFPPTQADAEAALARIDEVIAALPPGHRELARAHSARGALLRQLGRTGEAAEATSRAVEGYRRAVGRGDDGARLALAGALANLGEDLAESGRIAESLPSSREAARLFRELEEARPGGLRAELAAAENNLAVRLSSLGLRNEAIAATEKAVSLYRGLIRDGSETFRPMLAISLSNLGLDLADVGRRGEALAASEEGLEIAWQQARARPGKAADLARSLYARGLVLTACGRHDGAASVFQQALRELLEQPPYSRTALRQLVLDITENLVSAVELAGRELDGALLDEAESLWPGIVHPLML